MAETAVRQCLRRPSLQTVLLAVALLVIFKAQLPFSRLGSHHDTHVVMPAQPLQQQQPKQAAAWQQRQGSGQAGSRADPGQGWQSEQQQQEEDEGRRNQPGRLHTAHPSRPVTTASSAVMFGLIGRDVASELPYVLSNVGRLAAHFQQAHVVFVENESQDKTRAVFESWAADFTQGRSNRTARLVTLKLAVAGPKEMDVLAKARNAYIEQLSQPEYSDVSVLIAVDTDMCFAWDVGSMVQVIDDLLPAMSTEWHVLSANGVCGWHSRGQLGTGVQVRPYTPGAAPNYCDLLALVTMSGQVLVDNKVAFGPGTCDLSHMSNSTASQFTCQYVNGQPVVPVRSAFGGWALYDASLLRPGVHANACKYDGETTGCEHWSLSECLEKQFNATQLVATGLVVNWEGCDEQQQHKWDDKVQA